MKAIMLLAMCSLKPYVNMTKDWTANDKKYYERISFELCAKDYKEAPCVKEFRKVRFQSYTWICTAIEK